ncbi:phosphohydrolase [Leptolyngbya sp. 'hensonii']|nr:phosphonate degradation HD-domain oxygenase [Leptolyngbya sp. 'hensonii']OLP16734.1 phosphohydrolase [Leptolyngbya sp. 'hensonii']
MQLHLSSILELLASEGHRQYGGEAVSQLEHALQCANLAQINGATPELITACLLHDLGHLLDLPHPDLALLEEIDDRHEYVASIQLQSLFTIEVTEPIRLHVEAKRYLCAVETDYFSALSPASQHSLGLQGGIFLPTEAATFMELPHAFSAVQLRRWDEQAKVPGAVTPALNDFLPYLQHCLQLY